MTTPRRHPPTRHRRASHEHEVQSARMLSADEKRGLILAHHAARKEHAHPRGWGMGYYIGIAASCLVIITGWWMTLGTNLRTGLKPESDEATQILQENMTDFQQNISQTFSPTQEIKADVEAMKQQYQQAVIQERAFEEAAKKIQEIATSTTKK